MKRLSIISIDGVNWEIVNPLLKKGKLPFLAKMMETGQFSTLQTHSYVSSGSTWPSIHTGTHPGEHGIFFSHRQLKSGTYEVVKKQAEDIPFKGFWQVVSESGIPTITIDLPKAPLIQKFNGLALNSWGEEAPWYSPSYPKDLKKEIHAKFGKNPLQEFYHRPMKDLKLWIKLKNQHIEALKNRFRIAEYLMQKQEDWQLFVMAVNEIHLAGHLFWHTIDETHPNYDPALKKELGNIVEELMIITDAGLENLASKFPDALQLVISNNGMEKSQTPIKIMDQLLKQFGYMAGEIPGDKKLSKKEFNFISKLEQTLPMGFVQWVKAKTPKKLWYKVTRKLTHSAADWKKSKAFPLFNDVSGAVRINLAGREPNGIVKAYEYDQLCDKITADFMTLTSNQSSKPAVKRVIKIRDEFPGENMDELADLLVIWDNSESILSLESEKFGSIQIPKDKRSGAHTDKGIIISDNEIAPSFIKNRDLVMDLEIYSNVLQFFGMDQERKIPNK
ncbi:alkaline phosphatase family protein [Portibacter lacus]|uniref:Alkaline phosphatase family protein n=1 Tax=Portibacter lacus TaxID=1099794 RepID=A0AA37SRK5_9BACT|nr:alkaline phosphatase family protein [Portibacter lacus]GLR17571.1 hypothetical protein GCM10007940_21860 [Portibacter lacus]